MNINSWFRFAHLILMYGFILTLFISSPCVTFLIFTMPVLFSLFPLTIILFTYVCVHFPFLLSFTYHVPSFLTLLHSSVIQLAEETCTTSLPSCQQRTFILPRAEGETRIILFAETHSRNISSGKGSNPQETWKSEKPREDNNCNKHQQQNVFCTFTWFLDRFQYFEETLPPGNCSQQERCWKQSCDDISHRPPPEPKGNLSVKF